MLTKKQHEPAHLQVNAALGRIGRRRCVQDLDRRDDALEREEGVGLRFQCPRFVWVPAVRKHNGRQDLVHALHVAHVWVELGVHKEDTQHPLVSHATDREEGELTPSAADVLEPPQQTEVSHSLDDHAAQSGGPFRCPSTAPHLVSDRSARKGLADPCTHASKRCTELAADAV
jgi:hypothetical protein